MKQLIFVLACFFSLQAVAQNVYKTPSGKKYHLTPCKICTPPVVSTIGYSSSLSNENKAVGASVSVCCSGKTKKGTRCKHKTKLANGYCYQHTNQS